MLKRLVPQLANAENESLLSRLESMVNGRRLPHAVVIEGADKTLNAQLARVLARAFLCSCENPLEGECRVCRIMEKNNAHPDVVRVEGGGKTGVINVDAVRALQSDSRLIPADSDGKVFLLEDCDDMLPPAQNAFLKLFEEPPPRVMFIMTCTSAMKLLETIRSRACILRAVGEEAQPDQSDSEAREFAERFAVALVAPTDTDAVMLTSKFSRTGKQNQNVRKELSALFVHLRAIFREALICGAGSYTVAPCHAAETVSRALPPERIIMMMEQLPSFEQSIKTNAPLPLLLCAVCVRLRSAAGK